MSDNIRPVRKATRQFPKKYLQDKTACKMTEWGEFQIFTVDVFMEHTGGHRLWACVRNDPGPAKPKKLLLYYDRFKPLLHPSFQIGGRVDDSTAIARFSESPRMDSDFVLQHTPSL